MQIFDRLFLEEKIQNSIKPPVIKNNNPNIDNKDKINNTNPPPDFTKNQNSQNNDEDEDNQRKNLNQNTTPSNIKNQDTTPSNIKNQDQNNIKQNQDNDEENINTDNNETEDDSLENNGESIDGNGEENTDNLFSDLKPEQMDIKTKELKNQFKNINSVITASIDKINKISRNTYDDKIVEFIIRKLLQLRDYSKDYLINTFKTKSYLENQVEFQRLLITFGMISNLFNNIKIGRIERKEEIEKRNNKLFKIKKSNNSFPIFSRGF